MWLDNWDKKERFWSVLKGKLNMHSVHRGNTGGTKVTQ